jgi:hypothetical protein
LPVVIPGIVEPSAMRRLLTLQTRSLASTTELVLAHLRSTRHMAHGHRAIADQNEGRQFS